MGPALALAGVLAAAAVLTWAWNRLPDLTPEQLAAWERERRENEVQRARERHNEE